MDDTSALRIVTALANGTNPLTGEIFPADSPYQAPNVIRALFAAAQSLSARDRAPASASFAGPASPAKSSASGNAGKAWNNAEDQQLLAAFDAGKSLAEIAQSHGRTQGGVRARLEKHGRLEPSPATRWPPGRTHSVQHSPGQNNSGQNNSGQN